MQTVCLKEAGADVVDPLAEETTLIHLMFGGYLISKVKCMRCRIKSERRDRMMDLTVEIPGDIGTLEEALARYTAMEILDGENKYNCSRISPRAPSAARNSLSHELARSVESPAVSGISKTKFSPTTPRSASLITRDSSQGSGSRPPDLLGERSLQRNADSSSDCSSLLSPSDEGSWSTESSRNSTSINESTEDPDGFIYRPLATKHPSESVSNESWRAPSSPQKQADDFRSNGDRRLREKKDVRIEDGAGTPFLYSELPRY